MLVGESQVRQQLFLVYRGEGFDRFDLHDYLVLHNQIRLKSHLDPRTLIGNRNWLLADRAKTPSFQFVGQNCFVDGLQQAGSESGVDAVSGVHNLLRHFVLCHAQTTSRERISRKDAKLAKKTSNENSTRGTAVQAGIVHNLEMAPVDREELQAVPEYGRRSGVDPEGSES
jgi:hypothetical protein